MAQTYITHLCRNEKVRKSELTREKQRLLWEAEPIEKELAEIVVENGMVYYLAEDGCYYPDINAK